MRTRQRQRGGLFGIGSNTRVGWSNRKGGRQSGVARELEVCNSFAGGVNSGSAGQSSGKQIRAAEVAGKGATSRAVES